MRRAVVVLAAAAALAGCSTTTTVVKVQSSPSVAQTTFNAQAVTVAGCRALAQWENSPTATGAEGNAHTSVRVQQIIEQSAGTQFSSDLLTWVDDTDPTQAMADSNVVDADCAAVGVPQVIG